MGEEAGELWTQPEAWAALAGRIPRLLSLPFPAPATGGRSSPLRHEALESGGCGGGALLVVLGGLCVEDAVESWLRLAGCPRIWCHSG